MTPCCMNIAWWQFVTLEQNKNVPLCDFYLISEVFVFLFYTLYPSESYRGWSEPNVIYIF